MLNVHEVTGFGLDSRGSYSFASVYFPFAAILRWRLTRVQPVRCTGTLVLWLGQGRFDGVSIVTERTAGLSAVLAVTSLNVVS